MLQGLVAQKTMTQRPQYSSGTVNCCSIQLLGNAFFQSPSGCHLLQEYKLWDMIQIRLYLPKSSWPFRVLRLVASLLDSHHLQTQQRVVCLDGVKINGQEICCQLPHLPANKPNLRVSSTLAYFNLFIFLPKHDTWRPSILMRDFLVGLEEKIALLLCG